MSRPKLNWVREDRHTQPASVRISGGLITATALLLFLRIFWANQHLLMVAVLVGWAAFLFTGLLMIFSARSTVLKLWYHGRHRWETEDSFFISIRVMGIVLVAFMLFLPFQKIIRSSFTTHTVQHLGR
jgi:hypothetical protein